MGLTSITETEFLPRAQMFYTLFLLYPDPVNLLNFKLKTIRSNRIHSLKYLRFTTLGCKDIGIRKSEFVAKTQFLFVIMQHIWRC